MDKHEANCRALVEQLLREATPPQKDVKSLMLWQRGYLTGVLAALIKNDSLTRREIAKRIEHYQNKT
jgi:hypothetical protein